MISFLFIHLLIILIYINITISEEQSLISININKPNENILKINQTLPNWFQLPSFNISSLQQSKRSNLLETNSLRISYINGIYHSKDECQELVDDLEKAFKTKVRTFYLPSTGSWVKDALKAGYILAFRPKEIDLALNLTIHLRTLLDEVKPHGRVLHIAHSAGAIITYLSAKYHLTNEEKSRIDVITFGGGRSLTRKHFPGKLINYYSQNDPLVLIDSRAGKLFRVGTKIIYSLFRKYASFPTITGWRGKNSDPTLPNHSTTTDSTAHNNSNNRNTIQHKHTTPTTATHTIHIQTTDTRLSRERHDNKHNTSYIFLPEQSYDIVKDHSLNGPTYLAAIQKEGEIMQIKLKQLILQETYNASIIRYIRKASSKVTGTRYFWYV